MASTQPSPIVRTLYRSLLRAAQRFDSNPGLRALVAPDEFAAAGLRGLYSPGQGQPSLRSLVKRNFRQPGITAEGKPLDLPAGFAALRYLNALSERFTTLLVETRAKQLPAAQAPLALAPPEEAAKGEEAESPARSSSSTAATPQHKKRRFSLSWLRRGSPKSRTGEAAAPSLTAAPLRILPKVFLPTTASAALPEPTATPTSGSAEVQATPDFSLIASQGANGFPLAELQKGQVLLLHPLLANPYPKCVVLVLHVGKEHVSVVFLNHPAVAEVGKWNFLFPEAMRAMPCHIGGPMVSLQELPPVPNYVILHPYPEIPNSTVLVQGERPVVMSTGDDLPAIRHFLETTGVSPSSFRVLIGTAEVRRAEAEAAIMSGFWIPMEVSPDFVHEAPRLGRDGIWHGLLRHCGGEFTDLSVVGSLVE
eukprot:RCo004411